MEFYEELVPIEKRKIDTGDQLIGRISKTILHFVVDKKTGDLIRDPRLRKMKDPENLEYHQIEFIGAPDRYAIDSALYLEVNKIKASKMS